ncbi:hypothetical protein BDA96_09G073800 [Sorghum bicolor]|uniref:Uncharacterized protein n=2 Tax=Sorghum bicolor TaxID=4558 RepID=A0A921Q972_SORBI|nr:hypothetical protein BDA96_09G073800 [Sorghum bicolor]OQU77570.1 hypothetical protein SORBI_3009G069901 [Sorghum bicolor]
MAATNLIHPQFLADNIDSSPVRGRRGYPIRPGYSHGAVVMDSSMGGFGVVGSSQGRCGSISPISPPFGHNSSWDTT